MCIRDRLRDRLKALANLNEDPFDIFEYLKTKHKPCQLQPIFFFLLGDYDEYDKNIDPEHPKLQELIKDLHLDYKIGIHPSYASNQDIWKVREEMKRLENITHRTPKISRQHYLKLHLPSTYQKLIKCGIEADYSMGYASTIGFRAGVACSFMWYDLEREERTNLRIHPFQLMDVTLKEYMNLSPQEASKEIEQIIQTTRHYGGTFISLWHNSSFSKIGDWEEWKVVYERLLIMANVSISNPIDKQIQRT